MITQMEARPPYVTFGFTEVEDRDASIEKGYYVPRQVATAYVTPFGTKDTWEGNADEWLSRKREEAAAGNIPQTWFDHFQSLYERWKKSEEPPANGTAIKTWPVLSPSERAAVINANILTVEDLAQCSEQGIANIGMGGRSLKDKAQNWLKAATDTGKVTQELSALKADLADKSALLEEAINTIKELKAQLGEDKPKRGRPRSDFAEAA